MNGKILVADDSKFVRVMVKSLLESAGHSVVLADDGVSAVLLAEKENFDLIILDIVMPNKSGFEASKIISELPLHKHTPFIFLTAKADAVNKKIAFELGGYDYIVKPFDYEELLTRVDRWLSQKHDQDEWIREAEGETLKSLMVTISHYINNALAVIKGSRGFVISGDSSSTDEFLEVLDSQINVIVQVVNSLHDAENENKVSKTEYIGPELLMIDIAKRLRERLENTGDQA